MKKGRMRSPNDISERIRRAFVVTVGLVSVIMVGEAIMQIYRFNALQRRRSYY